MASLLLSLLGPFQVTRDGQPLTAFATDAARALLAYLATEAGPPHRREALAGLLWPEEPDARAMQSLRQTLSRLRQALAEGERVGTYAAPYLLTSHESVQLNPTAHWQVDVASFAAALAATRVHRHRHLESCLSCMARLREAVTLYRGEFMAGFSLPSAPFEEWLLARRESLRLHALHALRALAAHHERWGEHEAALGYARRQLELEGWQEEAHRQAMRALARSGQRAAALAQYEACRQVLREELDVEPEAETTALYERIRAGEETRPLAEAGFLPAPLTPFIGRERELAQIEDWLADPSCRLLTLVGPGGCGKTRLALEAARAQSYAFQHGVFWVSLASVPSPEGIVPAVAQALGLTFYPGEEPRRQLLSYLRPREVLLVLDNCEHLCGEYLPAGPEGEPGDGAGPLVQLLDAAPGLCILATSRSRLELLGERLLLVPGMEAPAPDLPDGGHKMAPLSPHRSVLDYSAVQLYLHTVRRAHPGYEPTAQELGQVAHLCRLVEGMPLAILLAAAWADTLSPVEIADHVARDLGFLEAEWHDLPPRQRSMRAVCDASWRLLSEREQHVFAALAVFRGGFTTGAAQAVAGADARTLRSLVHKSFLQVEPGGRYTVHELLRQYGEERLARTAEEERVVRDRHCAHYAAALSRWADELKGPQQTQAEREMAAEGANASAAWWWAVKRERWADLRAAAEGLSSFLRGARRYEEGRDSFEAAAARLEGAHGKQSAPSAGEGARLLLRVTTCQISFAQDAGAWQRLIERCESLLSHPDLAGEDTRSDRALFLTYAIAFQPRLSERSLAYGREALMLCHEIGDRWGAAQAHGVLGIDAFITSDYEEAGRQWTRALGISRSLGCHSGIGEAVSWLTLIAACQGQIQEYECWVRELGALIAVCGADLAQVPVGHLLIGQAHGLAGRHMEAHAVLEQGAAIYRERGARIHLGRILPSLGRAKMHLGLYEQARAQEQEAVVLACERGEPLHKGWALTELGGVALAERKEATAMSLLREAVAVCRAGRDRSGLGIALAYTGYAARQLGQEHEARCCLAEAIRLGFETRSPRPWWAALPAMALLLADRGEVERAVELHTLAWSVPHIACSRWYEDVAGRELAAAATSLPLEVREAAQARGRTRDMWATAEELAAELETSST